MGEQRAPARPPVRRAARRRRRARSVGSSTPATQSPRAGTALVLEHRRARRRAAPRSRAARRRASRGCRARRTRRAARGPRPAGRATSLGATRARTHLRVDEVAQQADQVGAAARRSAANRRPARRHVRRAGVQVGDQRDAQPVELARPTRQVRVRRRTTVRRGSIHAAQAKPRRRRRRRREGAAPHPAGRSARCSQCGATSGCSMITRWSSPPQVGDRVPHLLSAAPGRAVR